MLSPELLKKISAIEFSTRKWVDEMMSGQFRSQFKGHGLQFSEHRQYVPGDDVRHIDWKASARTREPLIKKFEEERELVVFLLVDVSASETFGSTQKLKAEIAAEVAGMLAYAAIHTGDKVGVLFFSDRVEKIIPPRKGRGHILRIIRDVLTFKAVGRKTDLTVALDATGRVLKHSGIVFVVSDFRDSISTVGSGSASYSKSLARLARRHDLVGIQLWDRREVDFGAEDWVRIQEAESDESYFVNTGSPSFKRWWRENLEKFESELQASFRSSRVDRLKIFTQEDHGAAVARFFQARRKKMSRAKA